MAALRLQGLQDFDQVIAPGSRSGVQDRVCAARVGRTLRHGDGDARLPDRRGLLLVLAHRPIPPAPDLFLVRPALCWRARRQRIRPEGAPAVLRSGAPVPAGPG